MRKIIAVILFFISFSCFSQVSEIRTQIEEVIKGKQATVGIAVMDLNNESDTLTINGNISFPTLSVYKFYLALAVLDLVDNNKLSLEREMTINTKDLQENTHSPLREAKINEKQFTVSISELLYHTVSLSDNNTCDILFELVGGTEYVDSYIKRIGIQGISVKATEEEMHKTFDAQYLNTSIPYASVYALNLFDKKKILSEKSTAYLQELMTITPSGSNKIKGLLPEGTFVIHKTGSSFRNSEGLRAADNDIGIVVMPDGRKFALAAFVCNSKEDDNTNASIIAQISKIIYDRFTRIR